MGWGVVRLWPVEQRTSMDPTKVDLIMKFALAVAGRQDTPRERELGPIHLIKLVYLADLAFAERHGGQTYTGAPWRFYHYGPWTEEVWKRIAPVVQQMDATERTFASPYRDDHHRWSLQDAEQVERIINELDGKLPLEVSSAIVRGVRHLGNDTTLLLHEVYRTRPMLLARPNETLRFDVAAQEPPAEPAPGAPVVELTAKQQKKRKEALRELRERVQRKLKERREDLAPPPTPPSYDEGFYEGVQWLDSLGGELPRVAEGNLTFSDDVWAARAEEEPE